jgi:hypothetical protein
LKKLLTNIQSRLNDQVAYLPRRDSDLGAIYVVPDENDLPEEAPFPCFGLKDGNISYDVSGGTRRETLTVTVIGYVSLSGAQKEESMIGDGTSKGVLDLMADAKDALDGWVPAGFTTADLTAEAATMRLVKMDPNVSQEQWPFLQKKTATYKYWREVVLP